MSPAPRTESDVRGCSEATWSSGVPWSTGIRGPPVALPLEPINRRFSQQVSTVGEDALHDRPLVARVPEFEPHPFDLHNLGAGCLPVGRNVQSGTRWVITPGMLQVSVGPEA